MLADNRRMPDISWLTNWLMTSWLMTFWSMTYNWPMTYWPMTYWLMTFLFHLWLTSTTYDGKITDISNWNMKIRNKQKHLSSRFGWTSVLLLVYLCLGTFVSSTPPTRVRTLSNARSYFEPWITVSSSRYRNKYHFNLKLSCTERRRRCDEKRAVIHPKMGI